MTQALSKECPCIYFFGCDETSRVKIGKSSLGQYQDRLSQLQTGSPTALRLLGVFPSSDPKTERFLHARFASARVHGEWFSLSAEIKEFIRTECLSSWVEERALERDISAEALAAARETRRQSQEDLAYALGCDRKTVGRWEAGKHRVSRMFRRQLAQIYPELASAQ